MSKITVAQFFEVPTEFLWSVITRKELMVQWYFNNIPDFKPVVGFKTQFNVKAPSRDFLHIWKVTEVVPFEKIAYEWTFKDIEGKGIVNFELIPKDNGTHLQLSYSGLESFPQNIPEFSAESCKAGWEYFINERLLEFLNAGVPKF